MANAAPKKKPMKSRRAGKKAQKRIDSNHKVLKSLTQ
jgi:hypothetical protein